MNGDRPSNVIEITSRGGVFPETAWTREWERTMRHTYWIEHQGLFYPCGTKVEHMTGRRGPRLLPP